MPLPTGPAVWRLGEDRANELLAAGAAMPIHQLIDDVLATPFVVEVAPDTTPEPLR